jgi:ABC-type phosphate transport system auxiliary subunit
LAAKAKAKAKAKKKVKLAKADTDILASLDSKEKKKLKKTLQAASPSEYFGQDFNRLGTLVDMMESLDLVKGDKKLTKKMKSIKEQNVDMLATSSKLRKQYEQLYRQLRGIVYPKSKGTLRDKK